MNPTPKPRRDALMAKLYKDGLSLAQIGEAFSVSRQRVQQILIRQNVDRRERYVRGIRNE